MDADTQIPNQAVLQQYANELANRTHELFVARAQIGELTAAAHAKDAEIDVLRRNCERLTKQIQEQFTDVKQDSARDEPLPDVEVPRP